MFSTDEYPIDLWIEPPLLNAIYEDTRGIAKRLDASSIMGEVKAIRDSLSGRIGKVAYVDKDRYFVYAIDSSFPPTPLELIGGVITIVSYGYVGWVGGKADVYVTGNVLFEDSSELERSIEVYSKIKEREVAVKLLKSKMSGKRGIDMVVLDGEIYIHPLPYNLPAREGVRRRVEEVLDNLLSLAEKTNTTIVGVVKRVRSRYLSIMVNHCLPSNDKLVMSLVLRKGEYVNLGKFSEILPNWLRVNYTDCEVKRGMARELAESRLAEGLENLKRVFSGDGGRLKGIRRVADTEVVFYKATNTDVATKLEVLDFGNLGVDNIVGYLASQTTLTGYPYLLDLVDTYVRVDPRLLDYVRSRIVGEVEARDRPEDIRKIIITLLQLTNPQKAYLYRPMEG